MLHSFREYTNNPRHSPNKSGGAEGICGRGYALVREVMVAGLGSAGAVAEELFSSVGFNVGGYYGGIVAEIVFELVFNFSCY